MHEILTLQLGNLSNYTGTHFWNTQESYFTYDGQEKSSVDHNVLWRPGVGQDGSDTFLPRTVIYDLKGGFGSMRKINALYDATSDVNAAADSLWSGRSTVHRQQPLHPSAYQESLDTGIVPEKLTSSAVKYWSDFSRTYFHPKSLVQLYDFELNSTVRPFERFTMGTELFNSLDKEHDIVDRDWRPFVEECDLMQGMQVFTTLDDAWGGFASSYIEALRDEYPKSPIWVWGLQSPLTGVPREQRQLRVANMAQTLHETYSQASTIVPLSIPEAQLAPDVQVDISSFWSVSALFGAMMESVTLPSRLSNESNTANARATLGDMSESLNVGGGKTLASAQMGTSAIPEAAYDVRINTRFFHIGFDSGARAHTKKTVFGEISCYRGFKSGLNNDGDENGKRSVPRSRLTRKSYYSKQQFPLLDSYPEIFVNATGQPGIPTYTTLTTDSSIATQLRTLRIQSSRHVTIDDRETLTNGLAEMADAYQDEWSSGSDEGDDDNDG